MALEPDDLAQIRALIEAGADRVVDTLRVEMQARDEALRAEMRAGDEALRAEIRAGDAETRRHRGVQTEDLRSHLQRVAESVQMLDRKLDRLHADHERRIRRLEGRPRAPRQRRAPDRP